MTSYNNNDCVEWFADTFQLIHKSTVQTNSQIKKMSSTWTFWIIWFRWKKFSSYDMVQQQSVQKDNKIFILGGETYVKL